MAFPAGTARIRPVVSVSRGGCMAVSRRRFVGGIAAALGYLGVGADADLFAQQGAAQACRGKAAAGRGLWWISSKVAKINNNENPYGVPPAVRTAMDDPKAWEWANRYGAPGRRIVAGHSRAARRQGRQHHLRLRVGRAVEFHHHCDADRRSEEEGAGRQPDLRRPVLEGGADRAGNDQSAAEQGLHAEHPRDHRRSRTSAPRKSGSSTSSTRTTRPG